MANKTALSLLNCYGGETSDDDEPYKATVRSERLPLPEVLLDTGKADTFRDDPEEHDGRIRSFAHERGNWASYVYIHYELQNSMRELVSSLINSVPSTIKLKEVDDYHVSLTKTVTLKYHWIDAFVDSIKKKSNNLKRFTITFDGLKIYCNEEKTRTFIGLQIKNGYNELLSIINLLDECLQDFGLPIFYKDRSFHMSIAWCVGDFKTTLEEQLPQLNEKLMEHTSDYSHEPWLINVDCLKCKIGNKYYNFQIYE